MALRRFSGFSFITTTTTLTNSLENSLLATIDSNDCYGIAKTRRINFYWSYDQRMPTMEHIFRSIYYMHGNSIVHFKSSTYQPICIFSEYDYFKLLFEINSFVFVCNFKQQHLQIKRI